MLQVDAVARGLPPAALAAVVAALAELLAGSAHLEFLLRWVHALCVAQGRAIQVPPPRARVRHRAMHASLSTPSVGSPRVQVPHTESSFGITWDTAATSHAWDATLLPAETL